MEHIVIQKVKTRNMSVNMLKVFFKLANTF